MARSIDIVRAPKSKTRIYNQNRAGDDFFSAPEPPEKKPRDPLIWYLILGLLLIVGAVIFSIYFVFIRPQNQALPTEEKSEETQQQEIASQEAPSPTAESTSTTAEETQTPPPPQTTIDKSQITIKVANGNGRQGEAARMRQILQENGFTGRIDIGNARSRYQTTIIYYNTDKLEEAKAVEEVVASKYETSLVEAPKVTGTLYDVVVALGIR